MPFIRISLRAGKDAAYREALVGGIYVALRETFAVPEGDLFALVHEHDAAGFAYGRDYLGIRRSDDLVIVQITANATRGTAQKRALYAAVARARARSGGATRRRVREPRRGLAGELVVRRRRDAVRAARAVTRHGGRA